MKKLVLLTAIAAVLFLGTNNIMASNHETLKATEETSLINADPTPPTINEFISTHFPKTNIRMLHPDRNEYEVKLSDNTEIEFSRSGEWKKIDCEHSSIYKAVPSELIPEQIATYVKSQYANQIIIQIEKKYNNWSIELNNDIEIKFDKNFNAIKIDD